jgi:hypothetical protein
VVIKDSKVFVFFGHLCLLLAKKHDSASSKPTSRCIEPIVNTCCMVEARNDDALAALSLLSQNLPDHCPTFYTIPTRSTELSRVGRAISQKCVWYCWKFAPSWHCCFHAIFRWQQWQHSAFPWMMHTESLFSILDGKCWMLRFAWNHQWEGGRGLGGTCASCGMDTLK